MKRVFLIFLATILMGINVYSQTVNRDLQWDFFRNVIPLQKSITISSSTRSGDRARPPSHNYNETTTTWTITLDDKYKVSFSGVINYSLYSESTRSLTNTDWNVKFEGTGLIIWENEKMSIKIQSTGAGSYEREYRTPNSAGDFFGDNSLSLTTASGRSSHNVNFDIQPEYINGKFSGKIMLSAQTLSLTMTGNTTQSASLTIGGNAWHTATIVPKSASELNVSSGDAFGAWNWNTERTKLFLKSENSDNRFVIHNNNGALTWSMELINGAQGSSQNKIETGEKIINLSMSIDGMPAQNISFIENSEEIVEQGFFRLDYVVFNRFLGSLDRDSVKILNQLKDGYMLILTYTINNAQKTDMFMLGGLKTILEYM